MKLSFTKPRPKRFLKNDTKFMLVLTTVTLSTLAYLTLTFQEKIDVFVNGRKEIGAQRIFMQKQTEEFRVATAELKKQIVFAGEVKNSNSVLKEGIQNLFDIVPDNITLTKLEVGENCLTIYGSAPSKDVFNYLLAPALKSIFTTSETTFRPQPNGWSNFVSVNKLEKETASAAAEQASEPEEKHSEGKGANKEKKEGEKKKKEEKNSEKKEHK